MIIVTKDDLVRFLQPFDGEIKIAIATDTDEHDGLLVSIDARYRIDRVKPDNALGIEGGEGHIVLSVAK